MVSLNCKSVPKYTGTDFNKYYNYVIKDFENLKSYFPLMQLSIEPTMIPMEIYAIGKLIPYEIEKKCKTKGDRNRNSIDVRIIYPSEYPNEVVVIEDINKKIDRNKIPIEHWHINPYKDEIKVFCTHHPGGEINTIDDKLKSIAICHSAWSLYMQYKSYIKDNIWILKDLKHGEDAVKQLKAMGKYYNKKRN